MTIQITLIAVVIIAILYAYSFNLAAGNFLVYGQTPALEKAKLLQYYEEMQLNEKILAVEAQCKNLPLNSSLTDLMLCLDFIEKFADQLKPKKYIP